MYCDFLAQEQQSAASMLGAILIQLLEGEGIPELLWQVFHKEEGGCATDRLGRNTQECDRIAARSAHLY